PVILMAVDLGAFVRCPRHFDREPASIRPAVTEQYFPKRDPRSGGTIYTWSLGPRRTAHLIARDFGHDDVLQFLMSRTPEDLRLALACDLGDEDAFRALLAAHPNLTATLSEDDRPRLPDAAQNNNTA